jgi:hypothetical protein
MCSKIKRYDRAYVSLYDTCELSYLHGYQSIYYILYYIVVGYVKCKEQRYVFTDTYILDLSSAWQRNFRPFTMIAL